MIRLGVSRFPSAVFAAVLIAVAGDSLVARAGAPGADQNSLSASTSVAPAQKLGLQVNEPAAYQGYTLIAPLHSTMTYLIDMQGLVVHSWQSRYTAGEDAYLLENGHLLRAAHLGDDEAFFACASQGGRIQEFTWDGQLVWDYKYHDANRIRHHAICRLPNGNILMNVWERKTPADFVAAGLKPELAGAGDLLVDCLVEVQPTGKTGGKIVWEWHVWDHLVQEFDPSKANYDNVAAHPELIDVNFAELVDVSIARTGGPVFANPGRIAGLPQGGSDSIRDDSSNGKTNAPTTDQDRALAHLKGIGYIGGASGPKFAGFLADWTHCNSVAYNAKLDQVIVNSREFSEIWIIDHSTTTAEAASHRGGRQRKGGDLLYRWGNPHAYRAGSADDQRLFKQHDSHWIADGLTGAGHLLAFNNGTRRPDGDYSSVDEIVLPVTADGHYERRPGAAFGPENAVWSYSTPQKSTFFVGYAGGAQRLPNGDTLICTGVGGVVFEVTPDKKIVWRYTDPASNGNGVPEQANAGSHAQAEAPADRSVRSDAQVVVYRDFTPGDFTGGAVVFSAHRYGPDFAGLAGKNLTPGKTIGEIETNRQASPTR
jgi:hypothetical protein